MPSVTLQALHERLPLLLLRGRLRDVLFASILGAGSQSQRSGHRFCVQRPYFRESARQFNDVTELSNVTRPGIRHKDMQSAM